MDEINALLQLKFETIAIISAGYISYRIAYTGKDGTHTSIDTVFMTVVFGWIAQSVAGLLSHVPTGPYDVRREIMPYLIGSALAFVAAALWRVWGEALTFWALRGAGVSASDRQMSSWQSILARGAKKPTQLMVLKTDGTLLLTETLSDFNKAPMGPCLLGHDGSVAMFVTDRKPPSKGWRKELPFDADHADWGYTMTYVPATEISEIRLKSVS